MPRRKRRGKCGGHELARPEYCPVGHIGPSREPPLAPFIHHDPGVDADPSFKDLFYNRRAKVKDITPNLGTEIKGIQLTELGPEGKQQLALFVAQKKVVVFRNQTFASLPPKDLLEYSSFFGRNHVHTVLRTPVSHPEISVIFHGANEMSDTTTFQWHTNSTFWHSDVSYEQQPPGTTFLYYLQGPASGGDTIFVNQVAAFRRLSPAFQGFIRGLRAVHSGHQQAQDAIMRGYALRRDPIEIVHPVVRIHPVTGEEALFVNPQFTRYILDLKTEESQAILDLLFNHITTSQDIQCRVKWEKGTVVVWDNRVTAHTGLTDFPNDQVRHLARLTPQAEVPYARIDMPYQVSVPQGASDAKWTSENDVIVK